MIKDGDNEFSALATGDSPTALGDTPSARVLDQGSQFGPLSAGGAYMAPWLIARAVAAFVSAGGGTIQIALQDSNDNGVADAWADRAVGAQLAVANAGINALLAAFRIPAQLKRYTRIVYRVGTAVFTAGTVQAFLTLDTDIIDLTMRQASTFVSEPSGALDEAVNQGLVSQ